MGVVSYRHKNIYLKRCEKCGKLSHYVYRMGLGQLEYNFCSGICADAARREFEYKTKNGISPTNPEPVEESYE